MIKGLIIIILGIILAILLIAFIVMLFLAIFGIKSAKSLLGFIKRKLNPGMENDLIDVEAIPVTDRGFNSTEKSEIMSAAVSACIKMFQNLENVKIQNITKHLSSFGANISNKLSAQEFKKVLGLSINISAVISNNKNLYKYTDSLLTQSVIGLGGVIRSKNPKSHLGNIHRNFPL